MTDFFDAIVVGSGPCGVQAAARLVEGGRRVALVDIGQVDNRYAALIPDAPFSEIRRTDPNQRLYFLGHDGEGIPSGKVRTGAQLTPPRQYVTAGSERWFRHRSDSFYLMESPARGGLGVAWGAGCFTYEAEELRRIGLDGARLQPHYEKVAGRIGISAPWPDASRRRTCSIQSLLPPLEIDSNAASILEAHVRGAERFENAGLFLEQTPLAVLSEDALGRRANPYFDMDYWSDARRSVYRPAYTLEVLSGCANFSYISRALVERFDEAEGKVRVQARDVNTGEQRQLGCSKLLLAAGTTGSARLALRSLGHYDRSVPLLCNPYSYVACVNLRMLGRPARDRRHSLAQLSLLFDDHGPERDWVSAQIFSYRSLLLFRLVQQMPLPVWAGLQMSRVLLTSLTILGVHHADRASPLRWAALRKDDGGDVLEIGYSRTAGEQALERRREKKLLSLVRRLGCMPLLRVGMEAGSSIHYAGTLPMTTEDGALTTTPDGRLRETDHVFVVDGAVLGTLPAKGLTFTIMANADRVASML